jgi:3-hydroxyacyl-[acyl-carrier-protein] dehydratase
VRFLFYDRILEMEMGKRALASRAVSIGDEFFSEHYSLRPVMPASLLLESVAQLAGWLYIAAEDFSIRVVLGLVQGVEVRGMALPGDTLQLEAWLQYTHRDGATLQGEARTCNGVILRVERMMFASERHKNVSDRREARKMFDYLSGGYRLAGDTD